MRQATTPVLFVAATDRPYTPPPLATLRSIPPVPSDLTGSIVLSRPRGNLKTYIFATVVITKWGCAPTGGDVLLPQHGEDGVSTTL